MTARRLLIIICILVLLLAAIACKGGDGWGTPTPPSDAGGIIAATATYGAEQFHLQLTAIATEGAQP